MLVYQLDEPMDEMKVLKLWAKGKVFGMEIEILEGE